MYCKNSVDSDPQLTQQSSADFLLVSLSQKLLKSFYFIKFVPKLINHKQHAESVCFDRINQQQQTKNIYTFFIFLSPSNVSVHRINVQNNILGRVTRDSVLLGKVTTRQRLLIQTDTNKIKTFEFCIYIRSSTYNNIHGNNDSQQPDPGSLLDLKQREPEPQLAPQSNEQDLEVLVQDNANVPILATLNELKLVQQFIVCIRDASLDNNCLLANVIDQLQNPATNIFNLNKQEALQTGIELFLATETVSEAVFNQSCEVFHRSID